MSKTARQSMLAKASASNMTIEVFKSNTYGDYHYN